MMNNPKKLNDGCIKIFEFIKLLYENNATYENVVEIFKDEIKNKSANHIQVVINKYLNTLKVFGIKVNKENNKYVIKNSIYKLNFNINDIKAIKLLEITSNDFPDDNISRDVSDVLENIKLRMSDFDKAKLNKLQNKYDLTFYYKNLKEQIDFCNKLCSEKCIVDIVYLKDNKEICIKGNPKDLVYEGRNIYLDLFDISKKQRINIPINCILSAELQPQKISQIEISSTVVYKVKNRLAKAYKVKENEYVDSVDDNGDLIIINRDEPQDKLLARLIRYMENCEIISPKSLRHEMQELIIKMLDNYDEH